MNPFLRPLLHQKVQIRTRGHLTHWEAEGGTYSITYRERDSLPKHVLLRLQGETRRIERLVAGGREPNAAERAEIRYRFALRLDAELDNCYGACRLKDHAAVVAENLKYFDRERYCLHAWCVMPNHVHVVVTPKQSLAKTIHGWKSYVAHAIGDEIWAREYFDRLVRDANDLDRTIDYVHANPAKAGLVNWPWVG
jgi:REP element-mobilizing transposase RayT